ncbi:conserved hypothetical protein [Sulfurovum sp. enrichment culture clone C5]|uniref:HNH domain-containing protein n=1 Tax=Sulfurovum sp. enrichment culture clone C5 TaxID=497650 RepID=A0A0S4XMJ4_9BACT|nr:conserved hypothetical protein [Sulfurovum sp. enrichment culture clone C5]
MIKIPYQPNLADDYYALFAKFKIQSDSFETYYNTHLKSELNDYSLRDIVCGDFEKLVEIKNSIGEKYVSENNIVKEVFNYDKAKSVKITPKISKLQPKIAKFFEDNIEVHTCYFCNIEFINKFSTSKKTKNGFTLDHFMDKGTYPYLALSLYNLVPSCYVCNSSKVKGTQTIGGVAPTSQKFDFDDKVKFKTFLSNSNLQVDEEADIELFLKEDFSDKYQHYLQVLELDGRYGYHKYKVIEMIQKRKDYPDSRIKELAKLTQKTEEEVKQDLFGIYLKEDLHKRPLSKLIKDISKELGLV